MKTFVLLILALFIGILGTSQTVTELKQSQLPKATQDYIKNSLKGATITKCAKMEDKGVVKYAVAFDMKGRKHIVIFDKNGNFLEKGDKIWESTKKDAKSAAAPPPKN
jgi:uncharacterized protein YxeA